MSSIAILLASLIPVSGLSEYQNFPPEQRESIIAQWKLAIAEQQEVVKDSKGIAREVEQSRLEALRRNDPPWLPDIMQGELGEVGRLHRAKPIRILDGVGLLMELPRERDASADDHAIEESGTIITEGEPDISERAETSSEDDGSAKVVLVRMEVGSKAGSLPSNGPSGNWRVVGQQLVSLGESEESLVPVIEKFEWPRTKQQAREKESNDRRAAHLMMRSILQGSSQPAAGRRVVRLQLSGELKDVGLFISDVRRQYPGVEYRIVIDQRRSLHLLEFWGSSDYMNNERLVKAAKGRNLDTTYPKRLPAR